MRQIKNISKTILLAGIILMSSCNKEYFELGRLSDEMEVETDLVAPLIHGSMVMGDIVARFDSSGYVGEFDDGLIFLAYANTLADVMVDTLDLVIDGLYSEVYYDPEIDDPIFTGSSVGDTIHFTKSKFFSFNIEGDSRVDSIVFKGGELLTELESTFLHTGYLTVSSTDIRDLQRNPYSNTMQISSADGDYTWSGSIDLDGFYLETEKMGDSAVFQMDYDLALINSGSPVNPGDFCEVKSSFLNLGFYSLYGFIDPGELLSESGELDIPIYADIPGLSHLKLADPRIDLYTESSLGVPFMLSLDSLIATAEDGSAVALEIYEGHPFKIPAPTYDMVGETVPGEIHINNQTSNFQELLNIAPSTLSYKVQGGIDNDYPDQHFVLDTSRFKLDAEFLLPLDLSFSKYALVDTLAFDLGEEGIDTSMVKEVAISLSTINELPIELGLQIYLLDESHAVLDSIFGDEQVLLASSEVDQEGRLVSASENTNTINLHTGKLGGFKNTRFLMIEASLVTSAGGEQFVKFYSDYSLDFEISFYARVRINTREL